MTNFVQSASPKRDLIPTKEYLPSDADLPSASLVSLASVKKVLSRGRSWLKKKLVRLPYLIRPARAGHLFLKGEEKWCFASLWNDR
jgi:hypothetical protein